jgi:membrane protease YdiL (CAAX protease family)
VWPDAAERYWVESRQPLAGLALIAPLLVVYEAGVLLLGPEQVRNGADAWLRALLEAAGLGQYFLLPLLTVGLLLGWHHLTGRPWRVAPGTLGGMWAECILLAVCLRAILLVQGLVFQGLAPPAAASLAGGLEQTAARAVGFLGAGIYEELLFRLILFSAVAWGLGRAGLPSAPAAVGAVVLSSLAFAAAHYVGPYGETLEAFSFVFRFLAGVFFAVLFAARGFGIAAGAHAGYDLLVGLF